MHRSGTDLPPLPAGLIRGRTRAVRVHDLRHTGHPGGAGRAVSLPDLKARIGHDSARTATIYQHAVDEADQKIANMPSQRMGEARDQGRHAGALAMIVLWCFAWWS